MHCRSPPRSGARPGSIADANLRGSVDIRLPPVEVKLPAAADPGEMVAKVVRPGRGDGPHPRIALVDVDGVLLNQNYGSLYAVGDNPLASFRDKLDAAARDPQVVAVLLRINSPGGSVTACDVMAEELRRFKAETRKPVVACLMDLATSGAYLVAAEADRIVAHPTGLTGGLGVLFNHYNLQDAMAQLNVTADPVKVGDTDRHGDRDRAPGRPDPGHDPADGRRLPRPPAWRGQAATGRHDRPRSPGGRRRPRPARLAGARAAPGRPPGLRPRRHRRGRASGQTSTAPRSSCSTAPAIPPIPSTRSRRARLP